MPGAIVGFLVGQGIEWALGGTVLGEALGVFGTKLLGGVVGAAVGSTISGAVSGKPQQQATQGGINQAAGRLVTVRQSVNPWQWIYGRVRVGGAITYIEQTAAGNLHLVITFAGHPCSEIETIFFDDQEVPLDEAGNATGHYNINGQPFVHIQKSLGDEAGQPFTDLVSGSAGLWLDSDRQTGRTKIYVILTFQQDLFANGVPNITAIIKGKPVYDPRSALTAWSDNSALCTADYFCNTAAGVGIDYASEMDESTLIASANECDETIALSDGSVEKRYTCNGAFSVTEQPQSVLERLLGSMSGWALLVGGKWFIHAGGYEAPTVTLNESHLAGPMRIQSLVSRRENANGVKGVFTDPNQSWQAVDFPPVASNTYLAEDSGDRVWKDVDFSGFTTSGALAQRLAKIDLLRMRQGLTVTANYKLSAYRAMTGRTVAIDDVQLGWSGKAFDVIGSSFSLSGDGTLGVRLDLRETAAAIYDWATDEESPIDIAPNTLLPDPFSQGAPGAPTVTEEIYSTTGSAGAKARAVLAWEAVLFAVQYQVEYKAHGDIVWTVLPTTNGNSAVLEDLSPGTYDFRLLAINGTGVRSSYGPTSPAEILGLIAPPADVTGFTVIKSSGVALAAWDLHADIDVRLGGHIEIRHEAVTSGGAWNHGVFMKEFDGNSVTGLVPLVTGTYFAKAVDSSGHYSMDAASFVVTEGMITGFTTVGTQTEAPTFSGTKSSCAVVASTLRLSGGTTFDSVAGNFDDALGKFDAFGGQSVSASYTFGPLDLGTLATRRFEADVAMAAFDNADTFENHQGLFDSADGMFDGSDAAINDIIVTLYAQITDTDPVGSPQAVYGDWFPFHVGDFTCRAAQFRLDMSVNDPAHNLQVSTLTIHAKVPA